MQEYSRSDFTFESFYVTLRLWELLFAAIRLAYHMPAFRFPPHFLQLGGALENIHARWEILNKELPDFSVLLSALKMRVYANILHPRPARC